MDSTVPSISFDDFGHCNYCTDFLESYQDTLSSSSENSLDQLISKIRVDGRYKPYDCIVGVSGGVDSSWVLVNAVRLGLRPLAVHMDNGWNSELAQNNISQLISRLEVDLYTHVIDWDEYKALMQAFFDSDVLDIELLYDNAMLAVCYKLARKYNLKYILSGSNKSTEGMKFPPGWNWYKRDAYNIRSIVTRFSNVKINTFPLHSSIGYFIDYFFFKIRWISFLDYFSYDKFSALQQLESVYGYKPYPYKHYESVFTRFYQGFILPEKFNVDKRLVHLSTLVVTGQISRDDALHDLTKIPYPSQRDLELDKAYFLKKMNWTGEELDNYLSRPEISHSFYGTELSLVRKLKSFLSSFKLFNFVRSFFSESI